MPVRQNQSTDIVAGDEISRVTGWNRWLRIVRSVQARFQQHRRNERSINDLVRQVKKVLTRRASLPAFFHPQAYRGWSFT
jgi:hypothetical protein